MREGVVSHPTNYNCYLQRERSLMPSNNTPVFFLTTPLLSYKLQNFSHSPATWPRLGSVTCHSTAVTQEHKDATVIYFTVHVLPIKSVTG
jgi:hypothetical protein